MLLTIFFSSLMEDGFSLKTFSLREKSKGDRSGDLAGHGKFVRCEIKEFGKRSLNHAKLE